MWVGGRKRETRGGEMGNEKRGKDKGVKGWARRGEQCYIELLCCHLPSNKFSVNLMAIHTQTYKRLTCARVVLMPVAAVSMATVVVGVS